MALLTTRVASLASNGTLLAPVAATAGGDTFANDGNVAVYVKNGSAGSITVTVAVPKLYIDGTTKTVTATIGAGEERLLGPFDPGHFNNASGIASITYSAVVTVTVAVVRTR